MDQNISALGFWGFIWILNLNLHWMDQNISLLKALALRKAGQTTKSNRYSKRRQLQILITCGILGIANKHSKVSLPRIDSSQEWLPKSQLATRGKLPQRPSEVSHKKINSGLKIPLLITPGNRREEPWVLDEMELDQFLEWEFFSFLLRLVRRGCELLSWSSRAPLGWNFLLPCPGWKQCLCSETGAFPAPTAWSLWNCFSWQRKMQKQPKQNKTPQAEHHTQHSRAALQLQKGIQQQLHCILLFQVLLWTKNHKNQNKTKNQQQLGRICRQWECHCLI